MAKKYFVTTREGNVVSMGENALRIAEKHFGINRTRPVIKETPIELLQRPQKIEIIIAKAPEIKPPEAEITKPSVAKEVLVKKKVISKKK